MTLANLIGGVIYSGIGCAALIYGKKNSNWKPMVIGGLLLLFPFFVQDAIMIYIIGTVLTISLFIFRE